jgi:hypothetical protein
MFYGMGSGMRPPWWSEVGWKESQSPHPFAKNAKGWGRGFRNSDGRSRPCRSLTDYCFCIAYAMVVPRSLSL